MNSRRRKIFSLLVVLHLWLFVFFPISSIQARENPQDFGIGVEDGTAIQIYYEEETIIKSKDTVIRIKIPQDTGLLEYDFFYLYVDVRDDNPRYVTIEYYKINETIVNGIATIIPVSLLLSKTFVMHRKANEWRDPRFAETRIDSSNFHAFVQTDERRMFIIKYQELEFYFVHQTNPALVEELVTRASFTATILFYGVQAFIFLTLSLFVASRIKNKLNTWVKFDFTTVALVFSWAIFGFLGIAIAEGFSEFDILRQIIQVPASSILFSMSIVLGLWIPSFFTIRPTRLHIIKYNSQVDIAELLKNFILGQAVKDPKEFVKVGYEKLDVVKTEHGRRYYRKADSLVEIIGSFLHGTTAIKSTKKAFILEVNLKTKEDYKKTFYEKVKSKMKERIGDLGFYFTESDQNEEILFVEDMTWKKSNFLSDHWLLARLNDFKFVSLIYLAVSVALIFALAFARQTVDMIGLFAFILGLIYILYWIYHTTQKYKYLEVDPCARSVIQLIYDSTIAKKIEEVATDSISELTNQRDQLKVELVKQESAAQGKWLVDWEMALTGKTRTTELPQIEEAEKKEGEKKKPQIKEAEVTQDSEET